MHQFSWPPLYFEKSAEGLDTQLAIRSTGENETSILRPSKKAARRPQTISMQKTPIIVHLIRHGEGHHNATKNWKLEDPYLTDLGKKQARSVKSPEGIELIISSPLTRAIQTTQEIWGAKPPCPVQISSLHSERVCDHCDEGREKSILAGEFPFLKTWIGWDVLPNKWTAINGQDGIFTTKPSTL